MSSSDECGKCGGTGWILETFEGRRQARPCSCRAATRRRERLEAAGIPERYRDCHFDGFRERNLHLRKALEAAREFVDLYPATPTGLLLVGPAGRGKTHLACAILSELIERKGVHGLYADFSDLLLKIQSSFRSEADASKESILTPFVETDLLVLDELGASKPHPWVLDALYTLLNTRYNRKKLTVATSNFEDEPDMSSGERERLEDRVGYRIRSRLYEMCSTVPLRGEDFRKEVHSVRSRF